MKRKLLTLLLALLLAICTVGSFACNTPDNSGSIGGNQQQGQEQGSGSQGGNVNNGGNNQSNNGETTSIDYTVSTENWAQIFDSNNLNNWKMELTTPTFPDMWGVLELDGDKARLVETDSVSYYYESILDKNTSCTYTKNKSDLYYTREIITNAEESFMDTFKLYFYLFKEIENKFSQATYNAEDNTYNLYFENLTFQETHKEETESGWSSSSWKWSGTNVFYTILFQNNILKSMKIEYYDTFNNVDFIFNFSSFGTTNITIPTNIIINKTI